jgi:hypothetical protein
VRVTSRMHRICNLYYKHKCACNHKADGWQVPLCGAEAVHVASHFKDAQDLYTNANVLAISRSRRIHIPQGRNKNALTIQILAGGRWAIIKKTPV